MKKVWKNVFASALPQIMNIITNLILPTLIISRFGSEINGLVSSSKAIVSYISIVGAGIATATTQALYEPVAKNDDDTVKGMLHAANNMFNKYGTIYCVLAVCAAFIYPIIIDTTIEYKVIVLLMLVISVSGASEFFAIGRCRSLLYANQKTYVSTIIQAASLLVSLILAVSMLEMHMNIIMVQGAISFVYVLRAFFLSGYCKRHYPSLKGYKNAAPIKAAVEKRNDAMIHQLSGLAISSSQVTILTIMTGLKAASIYSIYNIVYSGLQSVCANLSTAVTPFLGREVALNHQEKLHKMYDLVEFAFFSLVTFIYSVTAVMIIPFISIYTKNADISYIYTTFAMLFTFSSAFYILKLPSNSLINAAGHFKETRWRAIIEASLTVVLSIFFTFFTGINGVVIGTGIALCWRCLDTIVYTNTHILHCANKRSIFRLFRVIIIIAFFAVVHKKISINATDYFQWIKCSVVCCVAVLVVIFVNAVLFDRKTLKQVVAIIKRH